MSLAGVAPISFLNAFVTVTISDKTDLKFDKHATILLLLLCKDSREVTRGETEP